MPLSVLVGLVVFCGVVRSVSATTVQKENNITAVSSAILNAMNNLTFPYYQADWMLKATAMKNHITYPYTSDALFRTPIYWHNNSDDVIPWKNISEIVARMPRMRKFFSSSMMPDAIAILAIISDGALLDEVDDVIISSRSFCAIRISNIGRDSGVVASVDMDDYKRALDRLEQERAKPTGILVLMMGGCSDYWPVMLIAAWIFVWLWLAGRGKAAAKSEKEKAE